MLCRLLTTALVAALVLTAAPPTVSAVTSFGYTTGSDKYIISTGKGLTVTMKQSTCDITSINYNGKELQYKSKATHVNSSLDRVTSSIKTLSDSKKTIRVICKKTGLEQTYLYRPNENVIYMGTYHSNDLVLPELRFLARLDKSAVNAGIMEATIEVGMTSIEAEDVVQNSKGLTRSKYYSGVPFIDNDVHGVKSSSAGVYFVVSDLGYVTSSGGPFFRDINNKLDVSNELTFYMNSDHTRTEDYRYGFHGPYALAFTSGAAPSASSLDFSFFQDLGLTGFVPSTKRGKMAGTITDSKNVLGNSDVVVGFSNAAAQYWVKVAAGKKTFTSPLMKAGRYTATVYKKQLAVGTASVLINAGATKTQSILVSYNMTSNPIWRIGEWDGTPNGFLNADKIHKMHPSDYRMSPWKALTFKGPTERRNQEGNSRMLSGSLFRAAVLLTSGLLAVAQANTNQLTSNLNFQSAEERASTTSFGYKEDGGSWVIDSGAGLTVKVNQGSCDITSMVWNKAELQISKKMTHINSGLGKSVKSSIESLKDKTIQISCNATGLEHTYLFRPNENAIYMGTHHTKEMQLGELRFLARLDRKPLNNPMVPASKIDGMKAIEAHDVYADSKGVTASKFYSGIPFIDDKVHGVTGDAGGVYFVMSDYAYERSVGGPFFRDINNQCTEANELTFYMFSDHTRFEDYRYGFHGPYALVFTDGKAPAVTDVDFDFFQDLTLTGFVPEAGRGSWTGTITDKNAVLSNSSVVVGFSNADAQYWVKVDSTTKPFTS
ncbi:hypothetical protein JG688_00015951, partial [Phytophthora aleatoria]